MVEININSDADIKASFGIKESIMIWILYILTCVSLFKYIIS